MNIKIPIQNTVDFVIADLFVDVDIKIMPKCLPRTTTEEINC